MNFEDYLNYLQKLNELGGMKPLDQAYNTILEQIKGRRIHPMSQAFQDAQQFIRGPQQMAGGISGGANLFKGTGLNDFLGMAANPKLYQDLGTRLNAESGIGELASRVMLQNMSREQPELMQWFSGAPRMNQQYD